jgi:hypothetical protein
MTPAAAALPPSPEAAPLTLQASSILMPALTVSEEEKPVSVETESVAVPALALAQPAPILEESPKAQAPEMIKPMAVESPSVAADGNDLLGLRELFKPQPANVSVSDAEIERIAQLVIQKLSTQVIENVAWDVVPDITTKVLKEELKRRS